MSKYFEIKINRKHKKKKKKDKTVLTSIKLSIEH